MRVGLFLYQLGIACLGLLAPMILRRRVKQQKENADWVAHRFAQNLSLKPELPLIWLHGASLGECQINLELAKQIDQHSSPPVCFLFTCQTLTAAQTLRTAIAGLDWTESVFLHQMAPIDTRATSQRFLDHWQPDLAIFSEGEIWPNLLLGLGERSIPAYLVNARMTRSSLKTWRRFKQSGRKIFSAFQHILSSDQQTLDGLKPVATHAISLSGNLKRALPPPMSEQTERAAWQQALAGRTVLLAASTHAPEESALIKAWIELKPRPFLILAPRHPERGTELQHLIESHALSFIRRSQSRVASVESDILLADTIGEMGLWYHLADAIYLGGGHASSVGGHNPLEALRLGKPVITGPELFNFKDLSAHLSTFEGFSILPDLANLATVYPPLPPSQALRDDLERRANAPMALTLDALAPSLHSLGVWS